MVLNLVREVTLFDALFALDLQFAKETREKGCPFCGGRLHSAAYSRKARGGPEGLPDDYLTRMSLCCATCRRRTLPPSCLFMGRRVYLFAVIIASCALRQQRPQEATFDKLTDALGVSRRAVNAWLDWFATVFPKSRAWQKLRGLVDASVLSSELPAALLARFLAHGKDLMKGFVGFLRFLATGDNLLINHNK